MNQDEFFQAGKVVRSSGSAGELVFILDTENIPRNKKLESVFIQIQGNLIPFFIDSFRIKNSNQALVKLLDVNSVEEMTPLLGCSIFLLNSLKSGKKQKKSFDFNLIGFSVLDQVYGEIGTVVNIIELPMQELLEIDFNGKQILIPLVDEIIKGIDKKRKVIMIEAPEGLIGIYL